MTPDFRYRRLLDGIHADQDAGPRRGSRLVATCLLCGAMSAPLPREHLAALQMLGARCARCGARMVLEPEAA